MRTFKFPFESILKYKEFLYELKMIECVKVANELERIRGELEKEKMSLRKLESEFMDHSKYGIEASKIQIYKDRENFIKNNIYRMESHVLQLEETLFNLTKEAEKTSKEKKIFDRLKERMFKKHRKELLQKAQKEIEDLFRANRWNL